MSASPFLGQLAKALETRGTFHLIVGGAAEAVTALIGQPGGLILAVFLKVEAVDAAFLGAGGRALGRGRFARLEAADLHALRVGYGAEILLMEEKEEWWRRRPADGVDFK